MTAEPQPRSSAVGALVQLLVAVILAGVVALYLKNQDLLTDKVRVVHENILSVLAAMCVLAFFAAALWLNGHRAFARAKGYSTLLGLVLGLVFILGLIILMALPRKARTAEAPASEAVPPETAPAEGTEQP